MQKFVDRAGRIWIVDIDNTTLRRVKTLTGVHLLEAIDGDLITRLSTDPLLLGDVLYAICKPQTDQQQITDEAFGEGLAGNFGAIPMSLRLHWRLLQRPESHHRNWYRLLGWLPQVRLPRSDWTIRTEAAQRGMNHEDVTPAIAKSLILTAVRRFERKFPDGTPDTEIDGEQ